jgi:hypothetical protein
MRRWTVLSIPLQQEFPAFCIFLVDLWIEKNNVNVLHSSWNYPILSEVRLNLEEVKLSEPILGTFKKLHKNYNSSSQETA